MKPPLDESERAVLARAGFAVSINNATARCEGRMTVVIVRSRRDADLYIRITLPGGKHLECTTARGAILGMATMSASEQTGH